MSSRIIGNYYPENSRRTRNVKVSDLRVGMEFLSRRTILEITENNGIYFAVVQIGKSDITDWKYLGTAESEITIVESE